MSNVLIIGGHGLGDCTLAFQCAKIIKDSTDNINISIALSTRDEIFNAAKHFYQPLLKELPDAYLNGIFQLPEAVSQDHKIIDNWDSIIEYYGFNAKYDLIYYVIPDLLFRNPHAFPYRLYNTWPHIVKQQRLLTGKYSFNSEKIIYCGLQTTTKGYLYNQIPELLGSLAKELPDYKIYFPNCSTWNNEECFKLNNTDGVWIDDSPTLSDSLDILKKSCYFIGTCNGPSHLAYQCGIPRLILDPQYNKAPWVARWKENTEECVPIGINVESIINIVKNNLLIPETLLLPRRFCGYNLTNEQWKQGLIFKY